MSVYPGVFTAPVRGAYWFYINIISIAGPQPLGINLFRNQQKVLHLYEFPDDNRHEFASNGVTLLLEAGDVVFLKLPTGFKIYDDGSNYNTFGGFLLFPM